MQTSTRTAAAALAATALIALAGCSSSPTGTAEAVPIKAATAPQRMEAQAFAQVVATPGVQIIDVRTPEEFAEGYIEGAVNYNLQGPDFATQVAGLDPAGTYAVYCRSGNRSQAAVDAMRQAGLTSVYELQTGIIGWQEAGLPVVR
jgi:phage shock protein E